VLVQLNRILPEVKEQNGVVGDKPMQTSEALELDEEST
jgi:hypothetical protein